MKTRRPQLLTLITVLALLAGCEPSELRLAPAAPVGGGGSTTYRAPAGSGSVPASPLAPVKPLPIDQDPGNIPGQVETHSVASEQACRDMLKKFQQQGRDLKLEIRRQTGSLPFLCVFEGPDAQPGYYNDNRSK